MSSNDSIENVVQVFRTVHRMKQLPRQGEIYFGMKVDESDNIASHSFLVTWIARLLAENILDIIQLDHQNRAAFVQDATLCALFHDIGESVTGDLYHTTKKLLSPLNLEERAFRLLVQGLSSASRMVGLFQMYERPETDLNNKIAAVVKSADGFDPWLHGLATPSAWFAAWEHYNRGVQSKILACESAANLSHQPLSRLFRRLCDLAHYPDFDERIREDEPVLPDHTIRALIRCFKVMYTLKALPRHGFTIFGMKRSETDTFAGHVFTTSFLAYLIATNWLLSPREDLAERAVVLSLLHDLPGAVLGDVSFDLQQVLAADPTGRWGTVQQDCLEQLLQEVCPKPAAVLYVRLLRAWVNPAATDDQDDKLACAIVRCASVIDAWEVGMTTPSAWTEYWEDYRQGALGQIKHSFPDLATCTTKACDLLAKRGRIKPIRLPPDFP